MIPANRAEEREGTRVIEVDVVDGVGVVRLVHGKVNALDLELCRAIERTMRELDDPEGSVRAVVVTGTGRAFSAGVDLKRVVDGGAAYVKEFLPALGGAFRSVFDLGRPVVAAVNGHAIAGGCVLAAACDHRVMASGTGRIGVPELRVGVPFPYPALEIMRFALGPVRARQVILDGANHEPDEALALGLVDELSDPDALVDRALAVADRMATDVPADTFRYTKAQFRQEANERLDRVAEPATVELWTTAAADGRIRAFMDRTMGSRGQ
ncbi:enoyl-CoA hydratase/isomerase family protein [Actinoallomurus rhizosphaericola]|uniref:enoyl-CoA hydratase/isomerase family protein n=1 Tax=Actinoallomurus rhizosphaericola TaxID=2952536 RepID=UPI0020902116|nr:enoyl-CoA hydratase/isomerase family protein [Actinoallomurus rhizosphaericola]MCO5992247.1 enoyl-CoA hydratase/isomerase family protein [Actinoallomurus rhizosphaericola]